MSAPATILVIAATARELAPPRDWIGVTCGVGPVEAAVTAAQAIAEHRPQAVIQVGIAGARRRLGVLPGSLVVGTHAIYADLGDLPATWAIRSIEAPAALVAALHATLPDARCLPIGTSARVGGGDRLAGADGDVEAMEGFAVLRAAQRAGIPAIEVRAISNEIEEHDRTRWHFETAFTAITSATPRIVHAVRAAITTPGSTSPALDHA